MTFRRQGPQSGLSPFGRILRRVVEATPGAWGAVFTDGQGEPVDQWGQGPTIDLQISGAQWGLVLGDVRAALGRGKLGAAESLHIGCERAQILVRAIGGEYFVVLETAPDANLGKAMANLERAADELLGEM